MWARKVEEIVVAHGGTGAVAVAFAAVVAAFVVGVGGEDDAAVPQLCMRTGGHSLFAQRRPDEVVVRESGTLRSVADSPDIHWESGMPSCPLLPFYDFCSL